MIAKGGSYNDRLKREASISYSEFLSRNTTYHLLEDYISARVSVWHYCDRHDKMFPAKPNNIKSNKMLKCCGNEARAQKRARKALERHEMLIKKKDIFLVGGWRGMHRKTLYFCANHAEFHLSTPASLSREKVGLKCCKSSKLKAAASIKKTTSLSRLLSYLKVQENSSIQYVSGFDGLLKPALFHCKIHGKTLPGYPANILSGKRLTCCRDANKGLDGLNNLIFGNDLWTSGECPFYLFALVGFEDYVKIGISIDYGNRSSSHGKGVYPDEPDFEWWFNDRREARFMEEALKSKFSLLQECPNQLRDMNWSGCGEVFKMDVKTMEAEISNMKSFLDGCDGGVWEFALQFLSLDHAQTRECHSKMMAI